MTAYVVRSSSMRGMHQRKNLAAVASRRNVSPVAGPCGVARYCAQRGAQATCAQIYNADSATVAESAKAPIKQFEVGGYR